MRVAPVVAALSLATDLGTGFHFEHALRTCLLATWTARSLGLRDADTQDVYYASLLKWLGCTSTAHASAELFGDEFGMARWFATTDLGDASAVIAAVAENAGDISPAPILQNMAQHCEVGRLLAVELGLSETVSLSLAQAFARWNGAGVPAGLAGERIALPIRIALVAEEAERFSQVLGAAATASIVRARAGAAYDPRVVEAFEAVWAERAGELDEGDSWIAVLHAEPAPRRTWRGAEADRALRAVADFTDLKSPYLLGHSRRVAALAASAAAAAGLPPGDAAALRRAGWVHDLGRVAVSAAIWSKPGRLTTAEWEAVRLHTYQTDRILARIGDLDGVRAIATMHHERQDGSGYHRGLSAASQPMAARILAAADVYAALTADRPHRPALRREQARATLEHDAAGGRLDRAAVTAVLAAAGERTIAVRNMTPGGLTPRETEVLRAVARGATTKEVAAALGITAKTADNHVQHIYEKLGVSSRAGATLFALTHGLLAG